MRFGLTIATILAAAAMTGCATTETAPAAGGDKFVRYTCEGGKSFSARVGSESARIRTQHGAFELAGSGSEFKGDDFVLKRASGSASLEHKGKLEYANCKAEG